MLLFGGLVSPETPVWIYVCLLSSHNLSNGSDVNTLEDQFTVFRAPNNKLQFQQTSLFKGHVIFTCNSQTLTDQPRQAWVTQTFTQEELEERRWQCVSQHHEHFTWFERIEKTITVSADILQRRRGCMINSSGVSAFDEWGVNGEDFLTFEPQTLKWTPLSDLATPVAVKWNKQDSLIRNHVYGDFLNRTCPKAHDALKLKRATWINESAQTDMKLHTFANHIPRSTSTYLQCHMTASDLSGVRIQLTKDGVPLDYGVERIGPRPNGDGTVQMRVGVLTTMDTNKHYRCEAHSPTVDKSVLFDGPSLHIKAIAIGTAIAIWTVLVVVFLVIVVVCCCLKQKTGYTPALTNGSSMSSALTNGSSMSSAPTNDSSMSSASTNDSSMSSALTNGSSMSSALTNGSSMSSALTNGISMSPAPTNGSSMTPAPTNDSSISSALTNDSSMSSALTNDISMSSDLTNDISMSCVRLGYLTSYSLQPEI